MGFVIDPRTNLPQLTDKNGNRINPRSGKTEPGDDEGDGE